VWTLLIVTIDNLFDNENPASQGNTCRGYEKQPEFERAKLEGLKRNATVGYHSI
jgi:hypothetical protein